jgi:putative endonuclease
MFTTYILFSKTTQKYYTGHCEDFSIRIHQHNSGNNKSTKAGIPWEIRFTKQSSSRYEAMKLENQIKKRGAKRFLEDQNFSVG